MCLINVLYGWLLGVSCPGIFESHNLPPRETNAQLLQLPVFGVYIVKYVRMFMHMYTHIYQGLDTQRSKAELAVNGPFVMSARVSDN